MKHFLAILDSVPHCHHSGGGITAFAAVLAILEEGNRVSILILSERRAADEPYIMDLEKKGAQIIFLSAAAPPVRWSLRQKFAPDLVNFFPSFALRDQVKEIADRLKPDAILMYHWDALAAAHQIYTAPRLGLVGDPIHLPFLFRKELHKRLSVQRISFSEIKDKIIEITRVSMMRRAMKKLLSDCTASGAFAAHHAQEFKRSGVVNCEYFRTPTPDPLPSFEQTKPGSKMKILHIGHLKGIATLSGIELLVNEIIPTLEQTYHPDEFEIHIVGGYYETLPQELKRALQHPSIKIRGQISTPDHEFFNSHAVLVSTPIELGIRVRVITAFSFGSCVVAHIANQKGIPELQHEKNALLSNTGAGLASACIQSFRDIQLRDRMMIGARQTYEKWFSLQSAGRAISQKLIEIST